MSVQPAPAVSHRCHCWVKVMGCVPVQVPGFTFNVWPCCVLPAMTGAAVLTGGDDSDCTTVVPGETAVLEPTEFVAVTATRKVWSTSAPVTEYVRATAPATSAQLPPL